MIIAYRLPLPSVHLHNDRLMVFRTGSLDCLFTDGREVEIRNESRRFLRVCAEKDVADTNIPVIDPNVTEIVETLGRGELLAHYESIDYVPSAAHSAALSSSTSDVNDTKLLPRVASTTRCRVGLWAFDSVSSTNPRWLETRIATCRLSTRPLVSEEGARTSCRTSSPIITSPPSTNSATQRRIGMLSPARSLLIIA